MERQWLAEGAAIEFELPRNLSCAACDGGGCDACGRSGAVTLRGRGEPAEVVQLTLPSSTSEPSSSLVLRIPEHGGLPVSGSVLPRGMLLLSIIAAEIADVSVRRVGKAATGAAPPELTPERALARRQSRAVFVVAVLVVLWILLLVVLRVAGYA